MHLPRLFVHAVLAFAAVSATSQHPISAQTSETVTSGNFTSTTPFLSVTIGAGSVNGGEYIDRGKINMELMLGVLRPYSAKVSHIVGVVAGTHEWRGGHDAVCVFAVGGGCTPIAPETKYAALAMGAQWYAKPVTLAGMVGPGVFGVSNRAFASGKDPNATTIFGAVLRADVWFRVVKHLEVGGTASTRIMPSYRHNSLSANSVSTGLRAYW